MSSKTGILLAQLGTPSEPTARALRPYLRAFLGDPRVIEANRLVWWFILNAFIVPFRAPRSARLYQNVWGPEGSPLLVHTRAQAVGLEAALNGEVKVEIGMAYGDPSLAGGLDRLRNHGVDRILVFPMFPQYSGATTGSLFDGISKHLMGQRVVPSIRWIPPYFSHSAYISALAALVRDSVGDLRDRSETLLLTFHGLPRAYVTRGDPYETQVKATTHALVEALQLPSSRVVLAFQSRFGRAEWLTPYTNDALQNLASQGNKHVIAACPGFTADCLETLDEIGRESRELFHQAGGELTLVPCLNSHPAWIDAMAKIAREELAGWV